MRQALQNLKDGGTGSPTFRVPASGAASYERTLVEFGGQRTAPAATAGGVAFVGAGNYAGRLLIRAFKAAGAQLHTLVSSGGTR